LGAEVALAFAAGIAAFAVVSLAVVVANADGFVVLTIALCAAGVAAVVRYWGVAYAVPAALAAALAFDWFYIPPTHPHEFPDAESLADLLALIAVGVLVGELAANATRRAEVSERARSELADDQAALRRVATLVAEGVDAPELMTAVAREAGILLDVDGAWIEYYDGDEVVTAAQWSRGGKQPPTFERVRVDEAPVAAAVRRSGSVVRVDDFEDIQPRTAPAGAPRVMSLVGAPITVEGRQWGLMLAWSRDAPLPEEAEAHLTDFTELVATAIANSEARAETRRLADEQAALRRVATLVAEGMPPLEVFGAVSREVGLLLDVDGTHMARFESDGSAVNVASWSRDGRHLPVGTVVPVHGASVTGLIHESGRPERMESYEGAPPEIAEMVRELGVTSAVGAPIVVEGQLWGVMVAATKHQATLPAGTESRIMRFTELVATSISNTQSRDQTRRLADEQAALRRVATVAVESASPSELFEAVVGEVGALFGADVAGLLHYTDEDTAELVATWTADGVPLDAPRTWSMTEMGLPRTTPAADWPTRVDDWSQMPGALAAYVQEVGVTSSVGSPIVVGGQLWGALAVHSRGDPVPAGTELRLGQFTALAATAISSVQARRDLAASRARIVAAADDERRRVVRDLHDGAQQRLVHTVVTLRMARSALDAEERHDAAGLVAEALQHSEEATSELRELAHGIMPSVLARGGLQAGVAALASRMPLPVKTEVSVDRLPPDVEATAYFVIAEALTNVAKHAGADNAEVIARLEKGELRVHVSDDGVGGAKQDGSGLVGLGDRVAALQGTLRVESPADGGTRIVAAIPVR
jgi:signal transduction histidine kinase